LSCHRRPGTNADVRGTNADVRGTNADAHCHAIDVRCNTADVWTSPPASGASPPAITVPNDAGMAIQESTMTPSPWSRPLLAIEGPIGAGKTTLATLVAREWGAQAVFEQFGENPFLPLFYADRERYAWQTQLHFLVDRFDQLTELAPAGPPLVSDYLFDKDRIFAELNLPTAALRRYRKVYDALAPAAPAPRAVVYLQAEVDLLLARIAARGRPYERQIEPAYLAALCAAYDAFFAAYTGAPVLRIDAAADFEHDATRCEAVLREIGVLFGR
jgi:deoxyguanosine kinase